ncbi:MAG: hypothetical protein J1F64_05155 [Oscillospiraceae bacterium]|nr:hypothetical protein [Oscillospiraceae bacterium]
MRHAVIDVGSNTIRTVIHEINGKDHTVVHNASDFAGIIGYIKDGRMSAEGMEVLAESLSGTADICKEHKCDNIHCFATASLRDISNSGEVLERVRIRSGIDVKIISGSDEVMYDLAGLMSAVEAESGTGLDLGGGSCQLFTFENKSLRCSISLPTGSLRMYDEFAGTEDAEDKISEYVRNLLSKHREFLGVAENKEIYAIGGTARIAAKVCDEVKSRECGGFISADDIEMLLCAGMRTRIKEIINQICPERKDSLFSGCAVLRAICLCTGAAGIRIVRAGVREGFLYSELLKK